MSRCQREIECAEWKQNLNDDKHNGVKNDRTETEESEETLSGSWQLSADDNASERTSSPLEWTGMFPHTLYQLSSPGPRCWHTVDLDGLPTN